MKHHTLAQATAQLAELRSHFPDDENTKAELRRIIFVRHMAVKAFFDFLQRNIDAYKADLEMCNVMGPEVKDLMVFGPDLEHFAQMATKIGPLAMEQFMDMIQEQKATGQDEHALMTPEGQAHYERMYAERVAKRRAELGFGEGGIKALLKQLLKDRPPQEQDEQFPIGSGMLDGKLLPDEPTDLGPIGGTGPGPTVVPAHISADNANKKYGDRYGVDWVYESDPTKPFGG